MQITKWAATFALGLSLVTGVGATFGLDTLSASKALADASMNNNDMFNNNSDSGSDGSSLVLDNGDNQAVAPTPEETDCSSDTTPQNGTAARC